MKADPEPLRPRALAKFSLQRRYEDPTNRANKWLIFERPEFHD